MSDLSVLNKNHRKNCKCFWCPDAKLEVIVGDNVLVHDRWGCLYTGQVFGVTLNDVLVVITKILRGGTFHPHGGPRYVSTPGNSVRLDIAKYLGGSQEDYCNRQISVPDHPGRALRRHEWIVKVIR